VIGSNPFRPCSEMRVTRRCAVTLRDDPAEADIPSHRLLLRGPATPAGSPPVCMPNSPLASGGVLTKINGHRPPGNGTGSVPWKPCLAPAFQPADLWERSGRLGRGYTAGEGIQCSTCGRSPGPLHGVGPTHEEVVTALAGDLLPFYRQLPVLPLSDPDQIPRRNPRPLSG